MRSRTPAAIAARLTYQGVTHRYGGTEAVSNFDLDIAPGEIVSLLGPSGCGKTTLLRLAAGVERPTTGRILINEREVAGANFEPPERRGVGLMFQDFALFPHLSNLANVMFGLKSMPNADAEREARLSLERVGLGRYAHLYPHMLSGGEQQRVAVARALVHDPALVLADEPTGNLDADAAKVVLDLLDGLARELGKTVVMATHSREVIGVADRVFLIQQGHLVEQGPVLVPRARDGA
jgi:iron(III) transport system ATP-binding protein